MLLEIDSKLIESRLDGLKKIANEGGKHNEYPLIYKHFVDTLEFLGIKVVQNADRKHLISKI